MVLAFQLKCQNEEKMKMARWICDSCGQWGEGADRWHSDIKHLPDCEDPEQNDVIVEDLYVKTATKEGEDHA
jgi:hypothetical protein